MGHPQSISLRRVLCRDGKWWSTAECRSWRHSDDCRWDVFDFIFRGVCGVPSCLAWFGLKLVQVLGQQKSTPRYSSAAYGQEPWRANVSRPSPLEAYEEHRGVLLPREREFTPPDVQKPPDTSPAPAQAPDSVYTYEAPGRPLCPQCGLRPALFYCPAHQSPLCLNCVGSHDVPAECAYVPGWRTEAAFTGESQAPGATYSYEAPGLPLCPQCSLRPALFYCRTHRSSLCLNCIGSHDVPGDCSYDPSWRARKSDGGHSQTWSPSRPTRRKTGDVFGIS